MVLLRELAALALQLDRHHRPEPAMIEQKIDEELLAGINQTLLPPHEAEVIPAQRLYRLLDIGDQRLRKHPFVHILIVNRINIVEIHKLKQILVTEGTHRPCRLSHWQQLGEVIR